MKNRVLALVPVAFKTLSYAILDENAFIFSDEDEIDRLLSVATSEDIGSLSMKFQKRMSDITSYHPLK